MTLKEYLETFPNEKVFYLCARISRLWGGTKKEFTAEEQERLEKECSSMHGRMKLDAQVRYRNELKKRGAGHKRTVMAKNNLERFAKYTPLLEREILETRERETEVATNIIVDGTEPQLYKPWSVHEGESGWSRCEVHFDEGAQNVVAAVYKQIVDELTFHYKCEMTAFGEMLVKMAEYEKAADNWHRYWENTQEVEEQIGNGDYLIRATHDIAVQEMIDADIEKERKVLKENDGISEVL